VCLEDGAALGLRLSQRHTDSFAEEDPLGQPGASPGVGDGRPWRGGSCGSVPGGRGPGEVLLLQRRAAATRLASPALLWRLSAAATNLALLMIALSKVENVTPLSVPYVSVEIATLTRENGKTVIRVLKQKEVEQLIKQHEEEEAKAEREKKEKEQKEKDK